MYRALVVALAAVIAAGCGSPSPAPASAPKARPRSPLERAEAYERGVGVSRDYARAAQIYQTACASGRGDLEACRRLSRAILGGLGTAVDFRRAFHIESARCLAGAPLACAHALLLAGG